MRPAPDARKKADVSSKNNLSAFAREDLIDYRISYNLWIDDLFNSLAAANSIKGYMRHTTALALVSSALKGSIIGVAA